MFSFLVFGDIRLCWWCWCSVSVHRRIALAPMLRKLEEEVRGNRTGEKVPLLVSDIVWLKSEFLVVRIMPARLVKIIIVVDDDELHVVCVKDDRVVVIA